MTIKVASDLCRAISRAAAKITESSRDSSVYHKQSIRKNVYGEQVKKLDEVANSALIEELSNSPNVAGVASEELSEPIFFPKNKNAKYVAVIDPMDGSSNIEYQITVGTIFGFYPIVGETATLEDFLQPGKQLVLAGYTLYSSATTMILSDGEKVSEYFLKGNNFFSHRENIKCPSKGKWLSANACNYNTWESQNIHWLFESLQKGYSQRYVGSLVADFHRTLIDGGIFAYPADKNGKAKLRLLYECNPLAFIMKTAGGNSVTGFDNKDILSLQPKNVHDCCGFFTGSKEDIDFSLIERK